MEKIAVGPKAAGLAGSGAIGLDLPVKTNIEGVADALQKDISEVTVAVLDRPRHEELIKEIRKAGARIQLFTDGDVAMAVATCMKESPVDMLMGVGGSTEAVLAAAALKCFGGEILCRWKPKKEHLPRLEAASIIGDIEKVFRAKDLARSEDVTFTATGVINGPLLDGIVFKPGYIITHSVIITSNPMAVRHLKTEHMNQR
jgi:fructose-1,6-bisphosphatase II